MTSGSTTRRSVPASSMRRHATYPDSELADRFDILVSQRAGTLFDEAEDG